MCELCYFLSLCARLCAPRIKAGRPVPTAAGCQRCMLHLSDVGLGQRMHSIPYLYSSCHEGGLQSAATGKLLRHSRFQMSSSLAAALLAQGQD